MTIEDVDFLKQNSIKQSYIFLVDSADRDRVVNPTPSDYTVQFTTPFHNVVGMEVLDASIPRTMYNVDYINNTISFYIYAAGTGPGASPPTFVQATLDPGEYTIQTLVPALNDILKMRLGGDPEAPEAAIRCEAVSNPPDIKNTLQFWCPYPFMFDMSPGASTLAETLGFDLLTQPTAEAAAADEDRRYSTPFAAERSVFHSVDLPFSVGSNLVSERIEFEGPRGVLRSLPIGVVDFVAQRFTVESDGWLTQVFAALTVADNGLGGILSGGGSGGVGAALGAAWEVRMGTAEAPHGNVGPIATGTIALSFTDGTLSDSNKVAAWVETGNYYWLILKPLGAGAEGEGGIKVFYNDILPAADEGTGTTTLLYGTGAGGGALPNTWSSVDADGIYYKMSARIVVKDDFHRIISPGIFSLVGPRYVVLRCPEIEENAFRSLAYTRHNLGLAKIRLGVVGYSENRLDYARVPQREFHPIGKLAKITLRFVLPGGTELYDFKGVNHTITFAIHYYEPVQKQTFAKSIINPNYTGNILDYMYKQEEQESDSTDQEEDFNRDDFDARWRYNERYFLPENNERRDRDALFSVQFDEADDEAEAGADGADAEDGYLNAAYP